MEKDFRLYLVAKMYYVDHMRQNDIAAFLGMSNMMVSRLLKRAEEEGIVTIQVRSPENLSLELGSCVQKKFPRLRDVLVVVPEAKQDPRKAVGEAAAEYVSGILQKDSVLGISWGRTISEFAHAMREADATHVKVIQMSGGFLCTDDYEMMPSNLVKVASERMHAGALFLNAPMFVASSEMRAALMQDPLVEHLNTLYDQMQITVFGISSLETQTTMKKVGILSERDEQELTACGAVGDVCGFFLDAKGQVVNWSKTPCYMGASLQQIAGASHAVCLATGEEKAGILTLAVEQGYCNTLVISADLAKALLKG